MPRFIVGAVLAHKTKNVPLRCAVCPALLGWLYWLAALTPMLNLDFLEPL
jgi:hypothetical protein